MASREIRVNGRTETVSAAPETPLLWVLRDQLGLTGTKFGCGMGLCGACTVHLKGQAIRSCLTPLFAVDGEVITIEGLGGELGRRLRESWLAENVPQCGYCQAGQILAAAALLAREPRPTDRAIDEAMSGNLCRCGTYQRIRRAIHRTAGEVRR